MDLYRGGHTQMENVATNAKIRVIPAKAKYNIDFESAIPTKLKVCAYCRVSTDKEEQLTSYEAQVGFYSNYIASKPEWEYVGIYADQGITGTSTKHRTEFNRMITDCKAGLVDMVITKSVSRFARNTVDCLNYIRLLKELGIRVFFEKENIDTLDSKGEFLITLLGSLAEEESRSISTNIRWSVQKRFEQGKVIINHTNFLGYTKDEDKNLVIVPEEAKIIRKIYSDLLDGYTIAQISSELEASGILTATGNSKWHSSTVLSILTNEKYMGDCLLQKTYQPDFLNKKRVKNTGQAKQYYVENSHEGIVSKETFNAVQEELKRRKNLRGYSDTGNGKYSSCYPFSGKLVCACCGSKFRRFYQNSRGNKKAVWVCINHQRNGSDNCQMTPIRETDLELAFVRALNRLCGDKSSCLEKLSNKVENRLSQNTGKILEDLDCQIAELQNSFLALNKQKHKGAIMPEVYYQKANSLGLEIDRLNDIRQSYIGQSEMEKYKNFRIESISSAIKNLNIFESFNEHIFRKLITKVTIINPLQAEFDFNGIKILELL